LLPISDRAEATNWHPPPPLSTNAPLTIPIEEALTGNRRIANERAWNGCLIRQNDAKRRHMFNIVSLIIGMVALLCALIAFIPLLGIGEWLVLILAIIGAGVGMISRSNAGRNLNLFVIVVAVLRLILGHGIL
jgi:hypothetical protein